MVEEEETTLLSNEVNNYLVSHHKIYEQSPFEILEIEDGHLKLSVQIPKDMAINSKNIAFEGVVFSAANFAAIATINQENTIVTNANCQFLAPIKVDDVLQIETSTAIDNASKKNISITGTISNIKVFSGVFTVVILSDETLKQKITKKKKKS